MICQVDIADLNLSVRAYNAVCRAGIKTIPELYHKYQLEPEWLHREIGPKHMHEVGDALTLHREEVWKELRKYDEERLNPDGNEQEPENVPETHAEAASISIGSHLFTSMRTDLDAMLQKTIASMVRKESVEGSITLKINIGLYGVGDGSGIIKPTVSHKVTASITSKESVDGYVSGDYVLDYDEDHERYTMRELPPEGGQLALF